MMPSVIWNEYAGWPKK